MSNATLTAPCGCGGSTAPPAGRGGSCKGACGCADTAGASGFVRPRFFGGMLLTDDDLQAISDYTVGKRRLTNRHLFGAGVVCGLEVGCDPCKPGWLVVSPGYALDCCGNDIVVGCPEKIDALALLNDLRRRKGSDCGEPCDDQPPRDYYLVVSYAERPSDPVAPYDQDDCVVGDCEFSRVREGYCFDLTCDLPGTEPSLFDRLRECARPSDDRTKEDAAIMARVLRLAATQVKVATAEQAAATPLPDIPTSKEFESAAADPQLDPAVELLGRSTVLLAADAAHKEGRGPSTGMNAARRKLVTDRTQDLARTLLASDRLQALPAVERQRVTTVLRMAERQEDLGRLSVGQRLWLAEGFDAADAQDTYSSDAERIRTRVLHDLDQRGRGGCTEHRTVASLKFDRLDTSSFTTAEILGRYFVAGLAGCVCDAFNPPCPACADPRVPLARVRIEGCEVVDVCELERHWVLSPRALSYWLPVVDLLQRLLALRCCVRKPDNVPAPPPGSGEEIEMLRQAGTQALSLVRSPVDAPELRELMAILGQPEGFAPPAGPTPGPAVDGTQVADLKAQLAALTEQVRKLGGSEGGGGS
jgi:hypothetical protein